MEVCERAIRLVRDRRSGYGSRPAAVGVDRVQHGCVVQTLNEWEKKFALHACTDQDGDGGPGASGAE